MLAWLALLQPLALRGSMNGSCSYILLEANIVPLMESETVITAPPNCPEHLPVCALIWSN